MLINLLKKHYKLVTVYLIFTITIVLLAVIKIDYDVIIPAGTEDVGNAIVINGKSDDGIDINTVSVYSYSKISILDYLCAKLNKNDTLTETYQYSVTDVNLVYSSGNIQKKVSINNSIIAGYRAAGCEIEYTDVNKNGCIIHTLATYAPEELKIGDQILAINGENVTDKVSLGSLIRKMVNFEYTKVDEEVLIKEDGLSEYATVFTILRNGSRQDITVIPTAYSNVYDNDNNVCKYPLFGISTYEYNIIKSTNPEYKLLPVSSIGPSGGLMQSFYVYEVLTGGKLSKGLKIVGTGTVDKDGNAGAIGGIYQKVIAADLNKADIFFVPVSSMDEEVYSKESNYVEAYESYEKLGKTKMKLVPVASLYDIIDYLSDYQGGK